MDWIDLARYFHRTIQEIRVTRAFEEWASLGFHKIPEKFLQTDIEQNEPVSAAIRAFARQEQWPALSEQERALIYLRLRFGLKVCHLVTPFLASYSHPSFSVQRFLGDVDEARLDHLQVQEEDIVEVILIRLWNEHGREYFVQDLEELRRLIYGIDT